MPYSKHDVVSLPFKVNGDLSKEELVVALDRNFKEIERVLSKMMVYENVVGIGVNNNVADNSDTWSQAKALADAIANGTASGTFINNKSIVSPIIAGVNGYFAEKVKVGVDGPIEIDGANKRIDLKNAEGNTQVRLGLNGLTSPAGALLMGGDGVLSVLQYVSSGAGIFGETNGWSDIGIMEEGNISKGKASIPIYVPPNFLITKATLTLNAMPTYYENLIYPDFGYPTKWKQSRNLGLYNSLGNEGYWVYMVNSGTSHIEWRGDADITNAVWGVNSWSPDLPYSGSDENNTQNKIESRSGSIADYLSPGGTTTFYVETTDSPSSANFQENQGAGQIVVTLEGYKIPE